MMAIHDTIAILSQNRFVLCALSDLYRLLNQLPSEAKSAKKQNLYHLRL